MNRTERKALARSASRKRANYAPRRAPRDIQPQADATSSPDGNIESQAHHVQPTVPSFYNQPTHGGKFKH